jgi:hemolysin activation/secretion protein
MSLSVNYRLLRPEPRTEGFGNELKLAASYDYDTRLSAYYSFSGAAARASASIAIGQDQQDQQFIFGEMGVGILKLWNIAYNQAFVTRISGDLIFGNAPNQADLRLGGRYLGVRGFENDEAAGQKRVIASAEYRHSIGADHHTDVWGLAAWTRTEGALFADAVYLPVHRTGCDQSVFYDVGYGVRMIGEVFSISPGSLALDIGIPLNRCQDERGRIPVTIYLSFVQSFFQF